MRTAISRIIPSPRAVLRQLMKMFLLILQQNRRTMKLLDLPSQFTFYAQYHNSTVNQMIHIACVWPILWTALVLLWHTPDLGPLIADKLHVLKGYHTVPINGATFSMLSYVAFYLGLEIKNRKSLAGVGLLAALFTVVSYVTAGMFARLGSVSIPGLNHSVAVWKIAASIHVVAWIAQFVGHGVFEGRSPALLDNLVQAFFMAPIFVILEAMFLLGYKKDFRAQVQVQVDDAIAKWRSSKGQRSTGATERGRPARQQSLKAM